MKNYKKLLAAGSAFVLGAAVLSPAIQAYAADITKTEAKSIAFKDAGVKEDDVISSRVTLDYDDGRQVYDVEFYTKDAKEYDYEISCADGTILSSDYDAEEYGDHNHRRDENHKDKAARPSASVSLEEAKAAVLEQAGVKADDARFTKAEQDYDDGRVTYELEFFANGMEYEAEVDAKNGTILEWDSERWGD